MRIANIGVLATALISMAGCGVTDQGAPPLSSPSSYGTSVTLQASPDRITQDGISLTTVSAVVQDAAGQPVSGLTLEWNVDASDGRTFVEPSWRTSVTDASGRTTVQVKAPPAPEELPTTPLTLTISATPLGDDAANASSRQVRVVLVPPMGTLPINNKPVAAFTLSPTNPGLWQSVTFDASQSTDEGLPCIGCTYAWDFGDGAVGSGVTESHAYSAGGTFTVTLTVRDARGGIGTASKTLTVTAPTAPVAVAPTFSPGGDRPAGSSVIFDGGGATVGAGGRIDSYTWIWNDGTEPTMTQSPQTTHVFNDPGIYVVRLIVTDSFGRTATATVQITII